ncbi:MAG: alpha/beta hydrolase [bacterium]|nr:alpha/beta hydrolase [bacterium]MDZ4284715.1 alpha/beta hydrolase [Patescibacteria group bacterium]
MKIIVNNIATDYLDEGTGAVMLMLHGWKDTLQTFDQLVPLLAKGRRIVRLDLPGFGGTEPPPGTWGVGDYACFVRDFIFKLNINVDVLVGHSFGGRVALKGLGEGALSARRLVLIASAGVAKKKTLRNYFFAVLAKLGRAATLVPPLSFARLALRGKLYQFLGSDYFEAGSLSDTFRAVVREDLSSAARQVHIPTLLIWGREDAITPLCEGERLVSLIPGSTLKVFPAAGHFVHREKPGEVAAAINGFR